MKLEDAKQIVTLEDAILTAVESRKTGPDLHRYQFRQYAFGEEGGAVPNSLLQHVCERVAAMLSEKGIECDGIASPEPGGLPWAFALATHLRLSVVPIRVGNDGPEAVGVQNYYSTKQLYLRVRGSGERLLFVDDVISSGNTFHAAVDLLRHSGFRVTDALFLCARGNKWKGLESKLALNMFPLSHDDRPLLLSK